MTGRGVILQGRPDALVIRAKVLEMGGIDPLTLQFQVSEYDGISGAHLTVVLANAHLEDAIARVEELIRKRPDSHISLEPVGFANSSDDTHQ